jgi:hypothetical protein
MSAFGDTFADPALGSPPIERDRTRELLGQVMALVAVAVAFAALAPTSDAI